MARLKIAYAGLGVIAFCLLAICGVVVSAIVAREDLYGHLNSVSAKFFLSIIAFSALAGLGLLIYWIFFEPTISRAALGMLRVFLAAFTAGVLFPSSFLGLQSLSVRLSGESIIDASWQNVFSGNIWYLAMTGAFSLVSYREFRTAKTIQMKLGIRSDL